MIDVDRFPYYEHDLYGPSLLMIDDTRPLYFSIGQGSPAAPVPRRFCQCRLRRHAAPGLHRRAPNAARAEAAAGHGLERLGEAKFLGCGLYIYI